MAENGKGRLETACRCLDLVKPDRKDYLILEEGVCKDISSFMKSLSDPTRIRIIEMLSHESLYVCIIQHILDDISNSKLSYHLDILKKEGLIESKRQGNFILYSLTPFGKGIWEGLLSSWDRDTWSSDDQIAVDEPRQ